MKNTVYYAIGDIHGEADKLLCLHTRIHQRHETDFPGQTPVFVHLGDYVDRGPDSFGVVKLLMDMERDPQQPVINLKGNHEQMMLEAYGGGKANSHDFWVNNGGQETLNSYSNNGYDVPPQAHLDWMRGLRTFYWDKPGKLIFVHAGIDPAYFPNDGEDKHLWMRSPKFFNTRNWDNPLLEGITVVHGHTPTKSGDPDIDGDFTRVNIDTGACYGGSLTAAVLGGGDRPDFISV